MADLNQGLGLFLLVSLYICTCILNYFYLKWFNMMELICVIIIFKIIIALLSWAFEYMTINPIILYILLFVSITYGIINSDKKKKALFKLFFILQFWFIFTWIYGIIFKDINTLDNILLVFLGNYYYMNHIYLYSDLDPSNSKHILDALHTLLKEINFKDYLGPGGKGPNPDFLPYSSVFLNTDREPSIPYNNEAIDFDSPYVKDLIKKIDDHNNNIKLAGDNMLEEKNMLLSINNLNKPRIAESGPYTLPKYDALTKAQIRSQSWINYENDNLLLFFHNFKNSIFSDIDHYDSLMACKIYYESADKTILPDKFKSIWIDWHSMQCHVPNSSGLKPADACLNLLLKKPTWYYPNFYKEDIAYKELYDNILIVGLDLLCKHYMYTHLYNLNIQNPDINKLEFFIKGWEYYKEAKTKYYPFFNHYQWYCKLYPLDKYSEPQLIRNLDWSILQSKRIDSIPPLDISILSRDIQPQYYNDIRPRVIDYEQRMFSYLWGSKLVFSEFDSKDFFTKGFLVKKSLLANKIL